MTPKPLPADLWAPDACTLPTSEQPLRVTEFDQLFAEAVTGIERSTKGTVRLLLRPDPEVAAHAAALCVRETRCCSFFDFSISVRDGQVSLKISVPLSHIDVLEALADRAEANADRSHHHQPTG